MKTTPAPQRSVSTLGNDAQGVVHPVYKPSFQRSIRGDVIIPEPGGCWVVVGPNRFWVPFANKDRR